MSNEMGGETHAAAREAYLASIDSALAPAVLALDRAVMAAGAPFDARFSYKMLMYSLGGDLRHWVCAIGTSKKGIHLRFLYGVLLDDPRGVLRAGTSTLKTIDFAALADIDTELVTDYVREAVARYDEFKAKG
jgi:hypothetical protein